MMDRFWDWFNETPICVSIADFIIYHGDVIAASLISFAVGVLVTILIYHLEDKYTEEDIEDDQ